MGDNISKKHPFLGDLSVAQPSKIPFLGDKLGDSLKKLSRMQIKCVRLAKIVGDKLSVVGRKGHTTLNGWGTSSPPFRGVGVPHHLKKIEEKIKKKEYFKSRVYVWYNTPMKITPWKESGRDKLEIIEAILQRIEGGESENSSCIAEGMPRSTFRQMALREQLGDKYARALEGLATDQAHKIDELVEDMRNGTLDPAIGRIELDARKWLACKFLPKRYGEKVDHTTNGKDMPTPILFNANALPGDNSDKEDT